VVPGEAAARAGLQQGDVIMKVGGRDVTPDETVSYLIANTAVGARVPLDIIRDGKRQTVTVAVGQRPTDEQLALQAGGGADDGDSNVGPAGAAGTSQALGMTMAPLTPERARQSNLPATAR